MIKIPRYFKDVKVGETFMRTVKKKTGSVAGCPPAEYRVYVRYEKISKSKAVRGNTGKVVKFEPDQPVNRMFKRLRKGVYI